MSSSDASGDRLCLGVSSCLLGEAVRYDGGDKRDDVLLERLGPYVRWRPVCPEVELGLGVPRPPIRLEHAATGDRLRGVKTRRDLTTEMARCARALLVIADAEGVCGFVLKSRSPSCGPGDAPLHDDAGRVLGARDGAFAAALRAALPDLPVASEAAVADPARREAFLAGAEAYRAFRAVRRGHTGLRAFHRSQRFVVAARTPDALPHLCTLRDGGEVGPYAGFLFDTLRRQASAEGHARVLRTVAALIAREAPAAETSALGAAVDAYENGAGALSATVAVLAEAVSRCGILALAESAYLHPGPARRQAYTEL